MSKPRKQVRDSTSERELKFEIPELKVRDLGR